jgi:hypothetical protein
MAPEPDVSTHLLIDPVASLLVRGKAGRLGVCRLRIAEADAMKSEEPCVRSQAARLVASRPHKLTGGTNE